jgi:hypothetical protein
MAMITRRAAVVEIGPKRHELDGWLAASRGGACMSAC